MLSDELSESDLCFVSGGEDKKSETPPADKKDKGEKDDKSKSESGEKRPSNPPVTLRGGASVTVKAEKGGPTAVDGLIFIGGRF
jgi:hypothetical protein